MRDKQNLFRKGDVFIILIVLLLAGITAAPYFLTPSDSVYCEIQQNQTLIKRVQLAEGFQQTITVYGDAGENRIEIDGLRVRIAQAECPDQVCVQTGWLTHAGQSAVCLPNRLIVRLTGEKQEVDAIVGRVG